MFKLNLKTGVSGYTESGQQNPLRWTILFREEDGSYTGQAHQMKCRDYFNDLVAYKQCGKVFSVYGFNNEVKFQDGGLYILLEDIINMECFLHNFSLTCKESGHDLYIQTDEGNRAIVFIPEYFWSSTYLISLLTLSIRIGNMVNKCESWENMVAASQDRAITLGAKLKPFVIEQGFKSPKDTWVFAQPGWDAEAVLKQSDYNMGHSIHNAGIYGWAEAVKYVVSNDTPVAA